MYLSFHSGEAVFSGFYLWLNSSIFYTILLALLVLTISFHIVIAVSRQLTNNKSVGERYKKAYPKAIPRLVAWLGASIMLAFIVIHSVQMLSTENRRLVSRNPFNFQSTSDVVYLWIRTSIIINASASCFNKRITNPRYFKCAV